LDYSSAQNNFGGLYNALNFPNLDAFAVLHADGSITAWGRSNAGGTGAPPDSGYTKIYTTNRAFAALKADGSITAWGHSNWGGTCASSI
jgi:aryl-alcohol dehydrogenase-like predicted oxidoreductase